MPAGVQLRRHLTMTRDRGSSVLIVRRVAAAELLLGLLEPRGPAAGDEDYSLVLGPARSERLSWRQVRKLVYVATEPRATDLFYAPPSGATVDRILVRDGTVGSDPILKLAHPRVTWLTVGPEGIAVSAPPH
jgi:hypothetical protein